MTSPTHSLLGILYTWQTLVGSSLTVIGTWIDAIFAVIPVLRQLRLTRAANAVASFDLLSARFRDLEQKRESAVRILDKLVNRFDAESVNFDGSLCKRNPEWAHDYETDVRSIADMLRVKQRLSLDGTKVDQATEEVIATLARFADCLSDVHAPESLDFHDPSLDLNLSDRPQIERRSEEAHEETVEHIEKVRISVTMMQEAYMQSQAQVRDLIHLFEEVILNSS